MIMERNAMVAERIDMLIAHFDKYLAAFDKYRPFSRLGQYENHRHTIDRRIELGSAEKALQDEYFLKSLYATLKSWGIGQRGSRLLSYDSFVTELRHHTCDIVSLDHLRIDDERIDIPDLTLRIERLVGSISIVDNANKLVSCTKALHHILPDVVVPMDRQYTQHFFGWHNPEFQYDPNSCFRVAFHAFARIAKAVVLDHYVGQGWHTSPTKVLDNAGVGYCLSH